MSVPFYVAPEQLMRDKYDYARSRIALGRPLVAATYDEGIVICAENTSRMLRKISEIYDRIAFGGVGKGSEFDQLRQAGVRLADLTGYNYSREDVNGRSIANAYAQAMNEVFTRDLKPYEVDILVAEVADDPADDALYVVHFNGNWSDEDTFIVIGGENEAVSERMQSAYQQGWSLETALPAIVGALAGPDRVLTSHELEVAVLARSSGRRAFRRIEGTELEDLLPAPPPDASPEPSSHGSTDAGGGADTR